VNLGSSSRKTKNNDDKYDKSNKNMSQIQSNREFYSGMNTFRSSNGLDS